MSVNITTTPPRVNIQKHVKTPLSSLPVDVVIERVIENELYKSFELYLDSIEFTQISMYINDLIKRNEVDIIQIIYNKYNECDEHEFINSAIKYDSGDVLNLFLTQSNVNECINQCIQKDSEICLEYILNVDDQYDFDELFSKFVSSCKLSSNIIVELITDYIVDSEYEEDTSLILSSLIQYNRYKLFLKYVKIIDSPDMDELIDRVSMSNQIDSVDYLKELIYHYPDITTDEYMISLLVMSITYLNTPIVRYILKENLIGNKSCFCKLNHQNKDIIDTLIESNNQLIIELVIEHLSIHVKYIIKLLEISPTFELDLLKLLCKHYQFYKYTSILYHVLYLYVIHNRIEHIKFLVSTFKLKLDMVTITSIGETNVITYDTDPCLYSYSHDLLSLSLKSGNYKLIDYLSDHINISNNNYESLKLSIHNTKNFYLLVDKVKYSISSWFNDLLLLLLEHYIDYEYDDEHEYERQLIYICDLTNPIQNVFHHDGNNDDHEDYCPICMMDTIDSYYFKCEQCKNDKTHLMCILKYWYTKNNDTFNETSCVLCRHKLNINNLKVIKLNKYNDINT